MWEKIDRLLKEKNISSYKLSKDTGICQGTISDWRHGKSSPKYGNVKVLAEYFGVPISFLLGEEKAETSQVQSFQVGNIVSMPVIGTIKAGYGGYCSEEYSGEYASITTEDLNGYNPSECRILRVTGNSMYPLIVEGDTIIVHVQPDVDSDEVAVVLNADNEATIKKVRKTEDTVQLIPRNPEYETKTLTKEEYNEGRYRIYGKVLRMMREF